VVRLELSSPYVMLSPLFKSEPAPDKPGLGGVSQFGSHYTPKGVGPLSR